MLINSKNNTQVVELAKLNQKKYRQKTMSYLVVGKNAINEANKTNSIIQEITTDLAYIPNNKVLYVTSDVMAKIIGFKSDFKYIAQVNIKECTKLNGKKVLVLDQIQDPGNLGTILRTALAFGIKDIFIGENTVDIYNPKVTRAMQGVEFHLNFMYGDVYEYLKSSSLPIITTFLDENNQVNNKVEEFNLVIGNEGVGIDQRIKLLQHLNKKIDIKFESLNVAIASAIIINDIT